MTAAEVATRHARRRARLGDRLRKSAQRAWSRVDPARISESWAAAMPRLLLELTAAQRDAASSADDYLAAVLAAQGADGETEFAVEADAFAGIASDGRGLASLLLRPAIVAKVAIGQGEQLERAMAAGAALAELTAHTQVADAGRAADQVALASRPQAHGYVRMLVGDSCSRCILLAGRRYEWNAGFLRHPGDDCIHVPAAESLDDVMTNPRTYFDSLTEAEQNRKFTKAGAEAIRAGADIAKVVNARRGMQTATDGRLYTTEAAGRRPRLMPEQIFRDATDREDAVRLLRRHGYIR